ncbi:MAG: hypothetical protein ACTHN3_11340 [Solirubrobacterales bacterium]
MPAPLSHMDNMRSVDFDAALLCLHRWIGSNVKATVNLYGQFFGCGMAGELRCVEFLPPDHSAISLVLEGSDGVYLDPADADTFIGREGSVELLEFRMAYGLSVVLEPASHL